MNIRVYVNFYDSLRRQQLITPLLVPQIHLLFFFFKRLFYLTLQYCIGFAIYQNESATGIHVFPILSPPPSSLPIPSLWVVPVHQPQASSIMHRTWTGNSLGVHLFLFSTKPPGSIVSTKPSFSFLRKVPSKSAGHRSFIRSLHFTLVLSVLWSTIL